MSFHSLLAQSNPLKIDNYISFSLLNPTAKIFPQSTFAGTRSHRAAALQMPSVARANAHLHRKLLLEDIPYKSRSSGWGKANFRGDGREKKILLFFAKVRGVGKEEISSPGNVVRYGWVAITAVYGERRNGRGGGGKNQKTFSFLTDRGYTHTHASSFASSFFVRKTFFFLHLMKACPVSVTSHTAHSLYVGDTRREKGQKKLSQNPFFLRCFPVHSPLKFEPTAGRHDYE